MIMYIAWPTTIPIDPMARRSFRLQALISAKVMLDEITMIEPIKTDPIADDFGESNKFLNRTVE